jgi:hypothetical protein
VDATDVLDDAREHFLLCRRRPRDQARSSPIDVRSVKRKAAAAARKAGAD